MTGKPSHKTLYDTAIKLARIANELRNFGEFYEDGILHAASLLLQQRSDHYALRAEDIRPAGKGGAS